MKKNTTINDLRSDSGFFPIDNDGIWHSGIHIGINENEEISSPVNGKIIAANVETQNDERDNFFWICEELKIPVKKENIKTINSYSLLSNIESYKKYSEYTKFTPIKDFDTKLFSKNGDLPFGIRAVINTYLYDVPYIQLFKNADDLYFLNSTYFENIGNGKDLKVGRYKPDTEEKEINIKFIRTQKSTKAFITTDLTKDGITCPKWTVGNIDGDYFVPDNNYRLQYDELKKKEGYIAVDGNTLKINSNGYISFKMPEYFIESKNSNILKGNNLIIIRKNEKNKIKKLLEEIQDQIKNKESYKKYASLISQQFIYSAICNKFESGKIDAVLLILNEKKLELLFKQLLLKEKYLLYKKDVNNLELFISNETIIRDDFLKIQYKDLLSKLKDKKISYTECSASDFTELYKEKILSEMVTGLEVIYQAKEKSTSNGVFKCRPYLFKENVKYKFPFENQKINVYSQKIITDFAEAETKTKKGVLIFSDSDVHYKNDRNYDKEPSLILSDPDKECEITNLYELIKNNKDENGVISIEDEKYYKCKLSAGFAFIKGKDLKIKLVIDKPEDLENKQIGPNTFLGHVRKDRPYLDWSTFFSDNLLEIEPEKIKLEIPCGIKCKKIEKPKKQMFFSNNTCIKTSEVKKYPDFAKLEEVKVIITIYADDNKDCIEVNKDRTIKIKDSIKELYFYYHSYKFKKDEKSGEVKLSGGDKFSQYVQDGITPESEEVKIYAEKIILPKILNKTIKWDSNGKTGTHPDPNSYKFTVTISPEEISAAYNFTCPLYIDKKTIALSLDNKRNYGKGQIFTVYNDKEIEIDTTIPGSDKKIIYTNDSYVETKEDLYVEVSGIKYKIANNQLEPYKTNVLKEYWQKLIPLNYKYKNYVQVTDEKICPSDSLLCKVKELKEKLKEFKEAENEIFTVYLDYDKNGVGSNRIYKMDAYKPALKAGINRLIAYHPLEFDKELHSELMKKVLPHINIEEFSEETDNDIAAKLPIKEENTKKEIKENKFYFVYPPLFDEVIEKSKIREFNPYELAGITSYKVDGKAFVIKNNPGFMPEGTSSNSFTQEFNADVSDTYSHEGVDIAVPKAPIISGISGKVIVEGDKGNYSYGCFIVIQADGKYDGKYRYYLLAHLDRNRPHKTEDKKNNYVYPNDIVGYVGNTGHCKSAGINIEGPDNLDLREKGRGAHLHLQMFLTESSSDDFIKVMNFSKLKNAKSKDDRIACTNRNIVNPFDYSETYVRDTKK